ncbi:type I polyketide synthase [Streptomyces sp. 900116325]
MTDSSYSSAIAIVGMGGRFPGAQDIEEFWENLRAGVCSVSDFTHDELLADGLNPAELAKDNYVSSKGALDQPDRFEAELFGFSPRDAAVLDPQHRLLLETAWTALEDAGYNPRAVPETTGVYVGGGSSEHAVAAMADPSLVAELGLTQVRLFTDKDFLASWISYRLGLRGPSMAVQTACSTSLTAVHLAVNSLLLGECSLALAGGVSVDSVAKRGYLHQEGGVHSPDGRCRPFDERSAGTLPGNGAGIVVLRRYEDAVRDGATIYALIRGSAVTNDGIAKISMTAPGIEGQSAAITEALATAELNPQQIQYVEMHGTGTALGDQIEIEAATAAFGSAGDTPFWCGIGSVKSNVGHLDAAAGVTGLIKATLMLAHREFVPTANFSRANPRLGLERTPFRVVDRSEDWPRPTEERRRAGVTSVGMGGTNVHVVLEEAPPNHRAEPAVSAEGPWLLPVSARTEGSLAAGTQAMSRYLARRDVAFLGDVAHTLQTARAELGVRGYVVADRAEQASTGFRTLGTSCGFTSAGSPPAPVMVIPGEERQDLGAVEELRRTLPVFRDTLDNCAEHLARRHGLTTYPWQAGADDGVPARHAALFSVGYATAKQWASWGLRSGATVGEGLGEYVSAVLAGVFTWDEALDLVVARAELVSGTAAGRMLAVEMTQSEVVRLLNDGVDLAAVNGPRACVVSGPKGAVEECAERLRRTGRPHQWLQSEHALHSSVMDGVLDAFEAVVAAVGPRVPSGPYVSTVSGGLIEGDKVATARYWRDQLRAPVRLDGALRAAWEISSGPVLNAGRKGVITDHLLDRVGIRSIYDVGPHATPAEILAVLGELWSSGQQVDWNAVTSVTAKRVTRLPGHVFDGTPRGAFRLNASTAYRPTSSRPGQDSGDAAQLAPEADAVTEVTVEPSGPTKPDGEGDASRGRIIELLLETLGVASHEFGSSFLELGGDSLGAVHLANRIQEEVGIDVPIGLLVEDHSVDELIALLAEIAENPDSDARIGDLLEEIETTG